jgi:hypothetical protein
MAFAPVSHSARSQQQQQLTLSARYLLLPNDALDELIAL